MLAARDAVTGEVRYQRVRARMVREAPQVMRLTVKDEAGRLEAVLVTPNHPYLRGKLGGDGGTGHDGSDLLRAVSMDPGGPTGGLWTAAGYLRAGDHLASANGGQLTVVSVEVDTRATRVYNFEVAEDHTYAVGELQAWVHNAGIKNSDPRITYLYRLYDKGGNFLKWGIACNKDTRYPKNRRYKLDPVNEGSRVEMLALERANIFRYRGPLNKERVRHRSQ
jgi:hypothetical protein